MKRNESYKKPDSDVLRYENGILSWPESELRDYPKFPEFKNCNDDCFAEGGDVVLVCVANLLDETVRSESFEQARHLAAAEFRQVEAKRFVLQSANVELAANDGTEQILVVRVETG